MVPNPDYRYENEWEQREDARALARAKEVEADPIRSANARMRAQEMIEEDFLRFQETARVAGLEVTLDSNVQYKYNNPAKIKNL